VAKFEKSLKPVFTGGNSMRLFIGVWLSPPAVKEVGDYIQLAKQTCSGFKWTGLDNLHFTLRFLGEVPREKVDYLIQSLKVATTGKENFLLKLGPAGYFPAKGIPRIIWLGLISGQEQLITLADSVENSCLRAGFPEADKPFKPHLTIARANDESPVVKIPELTNFRSETTVSGFSLIESQLLPAGPVYKSVIDFSFK
jgi:RNA 2',3'-cyclic 3'-phosphodiesterase